MTENLRMRVALALLVDEDTCNRAWKTALRWREYGFGFRALRLPPHVSLKQPFTISSLPRFEEFFSRFAESLKVQTIALDGFRFFDSGDEGVIVLNVVEDAQLRVWHQELNKALAREFDATEAEHDGESYQFHLTVAIGRYQFELKDRLLADVEAMSFREQTLVRRLAMFVYEESQVADPLYGTREYGMYKILSLKS